MGQQITPFSIRAPGFYGLNLQDSPIDIDPGYALEASNCVIDSSGRIASRKGWIPAHVYNAALGTSKISCLGEVIDNSGVSTIVATGNNKFFTLTSTLNEITYGGGGVAPVISNDNWQFCQLNGIGIFWQRGYDPLIYDPVVSTTTYRRLSEKTLSAGTIYPCHTAISAYGRIWAADISTDKNTVVWSDIITPQIWTGGSSGSLNLLGIWPNGGDTIVTLAAHNNYLYIFGRKQILVYEGANDPSTMRLSDSIVGVGCIARDSVQNTGNDVIFLSDTGVRSILRTIQEKSAPLRDLSRNVRDVIAASINVTHANNIKSVYSQTNAFYLLTSPASNEIYCFDMRGALQDGASKVTRWDGFLPRSFLSSSNNDLYFGNHEYVGLYSGYFDNGSTFRMKYYTTWVDFGNPIQKSILKKIMISVVGATNQDIVFKYGFDYSTDYSYQTASITGRTIPSEWGIMEWGSFEWGGSTTTEVLSVNAGGVGSVIQFGFEAEVSNYPISIQRIDIYTKDGKL